MQEFVSRISPKPVGGLEVNNQSDIWSWRVPMATDSVDVLERIASQLFTTSHEKHFNEEEIQVVSYPNKLFADMKSEPLPDASVPNMDVVINAPVSGGISLMPSSLSQVDTFVFQQLPEEFLAKFKYLLDTPNEQLWPWVSKFVKCHEYPQWKPQPLSTVVPGLPEDGHNDVFRCCYICTIVYLWEARLRGFLPLVLLYQHVASHGRRISNSCGAHSILGSHLYSLLGMAIEILVHLLGLSITIACIVLSSSLTSPFACALGLCFTRVGQPSMLGLSHKRLS
ncbi:Cyclin-dependent kinase B2-1 [Capsicum chinense]|nr:Cyclin-dependent kinase B2-1 [Capsicum chinense]